MLAIRPRFSIAALMGFVFVFGVGLAAFRYPNKLWASFLFSIALGAMVMASLGALFHRGLPQKFWAGYAICGWLYLLMNWVPWFGIAVSPYLFTTACLDLIYPHVAAVEQTAMVAGDNVFGLAGGFGASPFFSAETIREHWTTIDSAKGGFVIANNFEVNRSIPFHMIGHALFAFLFAYLGGITARRFARLGANGPLGVGNQGGGLSLTH
jgi:hypothetical protein